MRWYKRLFWKIFASVWVVSMTGIALSLSVYLHFSDPEAQSAQQQLRAERAARAVLEHRLDGERDERSARDRRRTPIWIRDLDTGRLIYGFGPPPPPEAVSFFLFDRSGTRYQVLFLPAPRSLGLERLVGFFISVQALWILAVSLFSSLLLTWVIVRPINGLRAYIQRAHREADLSVRVESGLDRRSDELGDLAREFNTMADYAERTVQEKDALIRDISHELRAPLARLRVVAGIAEQQLGANAHPLTQIDRECERLDSLISELLEFSRVGESRSDERIRLDELAKELKQEFEDWGQGRVLEISLSDTIAKHMILQEPLRRILSNTLRNIIIHTPKGTDAQLDLGISANQVVAVVSDSGPGVSESDRNQLGTPFRKGGGSAGYGLGLALCIRAAKSAGGSVRFGQSGLGGLEVRVELPLESGSSSLAQK